jgi:hypothetical protein
MYSPLNNFCPEDIFTDSDGTMYPWFDLGYDESEEIHWDTPIVLGCEEPPTPLPEGCPF